MSGDSKKNRLRNSLITIIIILIAFLLYGFYHPYNLVFVTGHPENIKRETSVSILFVGDIMLDRNVRNIIEKKGFDKFFNGVENTVKDADIAVGNLEGPFTPYPSLTASLVNKVLQFTFDPALAPALADIGFDILGLANNHTLNFGKEGLEMTRRYIGRSGMTYYGDPLNKDEISTIFTRNNISVAFIGFHEFNYVNYENVYNEIEKLRSGVDIIIVTPHWGIEYEKKPTQKMVEWAHSFIDSGADAVMGTHTHIIGDSEMYKNKKIYYSLGNFAFDQYFSKETMQGLGVVMNIHKSKENINIDYAEIPFVVDREGVRVGFP